MAFSTSANPVGKEIRAFLRGASTRGNEGFVEAFHHTTTSTSVHDDDGGSLIDDTIDDTVPPTDDDNYTTYLGSGKVRHSSDAESDAETDVDVVFEAADKKLGSN